MSNRKTSRVTSSWDLTRRDTIGQDDIIQQVHLARRVEIADDTTTGRPADDSPLNEEFLYTRRGSAHRAQRRQHRDRDI